MRLLKVDDKAVVFANHSAHQFGIGDVVVIKYLDVDNDESYFAVLDGVTPNKENMFDTREAWWVSDDDVFAYEADNDTSEW